jgi:diguanylate cyclase (GGDEF)-like protein/PAS domain S-box-containing protein
MTEIFERKLQATTERLEMLFRRADPAGATGQVLTAEDLQELADAMEELHVAGEELTEKNDELALAHAEAELERHRYREIFRMAPDGYLVTDLSGIVTEANRAAADLFRVRFDLLVGKPLVLFLGRESRQGFTTRLARLARGEEAKEWELQIQPRGAPPVPTSVAVAPARDVGGGVMGLRWVIHDITQRKQTEEEMTFLAYHDRLTGLPNRAKLEELLGLALARATRQDLTVAVLCMDLDNFKLINDSLGHDAGDELLRDVSARLIQAARDTDCVARLGGDEFLVLLGDLDGRDPGSNVDRTRSAELIAERVAARIQECLQLPYDINGTEVYTSTSIGISLFPQDATDAKTLITNADAAMYRSKKAGPGGYVLFAEGDAASRTMLSRATSLRKAAEQSSWVLHYQPIVDLTRSEVVGVEALIRERAPDGQLVMPGEFIKLAEDMGLIDAIGDWVLGELCRQCEAWRGQGLDLDVTFNLSPHQLRQAGMAKVVLDRLLSAGVDPKRVTLDITESTAMTNYAGARQILWDLHNEGLRLAIDDFGTGYSSLGRLRQLPIDTIKIDRSLVSQIRAEHDEGPMVTAIIQLARSLGLVPVAKGIETAAQCRYVVEGGCTLGQGFLFSQAVPGDRITPSFLRGELQPVLQSAVQ